MGEAVRRTGHRDARAATGKRHHKTLGQRMSDHVAYALLVYTGLLIFVTMGALDKSGSSMSLLPYFSLVILVALIIPACRKFEARWLAFDEQGEAASDVKSRFTRDVLILWGVAIGLPFALTALAKVLLA